MALNTLCDFTGSLSCMSSSKAEGTICHDTPYLSLSHAHCNWSPPSESFSHNSSTSLCVSQFTKKEIAGENLYCGPPFNAVNSCPSRENVTIITVPLGPGPASPYRLTLPIFEFLKMET